MPGIESHLFLHIQLSHLKMNNCYNCNEYDMLQSIIITVGVSEFSSRNICNECIDEATAFMLNMKNHDCIFSLERCTVCQVQVCDLCVVSLDLNRYLHRDICTDCTKDILKCTRNVLKMY